MTVGLLSKTYFMNVLKSPLFSMIVFAVAGAIVGHSIGMLGTGAEERKKYLAKAAAVLGAVAGLSLSTLGTVYDLAMNWAFLFLISGLIASFVWHYLDGLLEHRHRKFTVPGAVALAVIIWLTLAGLSRGRGLEEAASILLTVLIVVVVGAVIIGVIWLTKKFGPVDVLKEVERAEQRISDVESKIDQGFDRVIQSIGQVNTGVTNVGSSIDALSGRIDLVITKLSDWENRFFVPSEQQLQRIISAVASVGSLALDQKKFLENWKGQFDKFDSFVASEIANLKKSVDSVVNGMTTSLETLSQIKKDQDSLISGFKKFETQQDALEKRLGQLPEDLKTQLLPEFENIKKETQDVFKTLHVENDNITKSISELRSTIEGVEQSLLQQHSQQVEQLKSELLQQINSVKDDIGVVFDAQAEIERGIEAAKDELKRKLIELLSRIGQIRYSVTRMAEHVRNTESTVDSCKSMLLKIKDLILMSTTNTTEAKEKLKKARERTQKIYITIRGAKRGKAISVHLTLIDELLKKMKCLVETLENLGKKQSITTEDIPPIKTMLGEIDGFRQKLKREIANIAAFETEFPEKARTLNLPAIKQTLVAAAEDNGVLYQDLIPLRAAIMQEPPNLDSIKNALTELANHAHAEKLVLPEVAMVEAAIKKSSI